MYMQNAVCLGASKIFIGGHIYGDISAFQHSFCFLSLSLSNTGHISKVWWKLQPSDIFLANSSMFPSKMSCGVWINKSHAEGVFIQTRRYRHVIVRLFSWFALFFWSPNLWSFRSMQIYKINLTLVWRGLTSPRWRKITSDWTRIHKFPLFVLKPQSHAWRYCMHSLDLKKQSGDCFK